MTTWLSILVLCAACAAAARADDAPAAQTPTAAGPPAATAAGPEAAEEPAATTETARASRDPFGTSARMRAEAGRLGTGEFQPALTGEQIPRLTLRGFIEVRGKPAIALIEVEGAGVHMVRQGDTLTLRLGARTPTLRIAKVDNVSVRVEVGTLAQVIVVR